MCACLVVDLAELKATNHSLCLSLPLSVSLSLSVSLILSSATFPILLLLPSGQQQHVPLSCALLGTGKRGVGRTGTMIACYLVHARLSPSASHALNLYASVRTTNKSGAQKTHICVNEILSSPCVSFVRARARV